MKGTAKIQKNILLLFSATSTGYLFLNPKERTKTSDDS